MVSRYNDLVSINADADNDPTKINWNRGLRADFARQRQHIFREDRLFVGEYRPFMKQHVYFDRALNDTVYRMPSAFPAPDQPNHGIYVVGSGSAVPFTAIATNCLPDLHLTGAGSGGQYFPRWIYEDAARTGHPALDDDVVTGPHRVDNISVTVVADCTRRVGRSVTGDEYFAWVYGVLHSPQYRQTFAADLTKMLPRIPAPTSAEQFDQLVEIGQRLLDLHINYEDAAPYPLQEESKSVLSKDDPELWRVGKMRWRSKSDRSAIVYNGHLTLAGIPNEAHDYMLGSRTALEWIIDRYQVRTDKASKIVNDPNDWGAEQDNPRYIVDLIKKVTTVSVATVGLVKSIPELALGG